MGNGLRDLNDALFAEIRRLGNPDLKGEDLTEEVKRARAVCDVGTRIIANGRLLLEAARAAETNPDVRKLALLSDK
jgi:hypothetical protein